MNPIYSGIYWHSVKIYFFPSLTKRRASRIRCRGYQRLSVCHYKSGQKNNKSQEFIFYLLRKTKHQKHLFFSPLFCRNGAKNFYLCKDEQHRNICMSSAEMMTIHHRAQTRCSPCVFKATCLLHTFISAF